MCVADTVGGLSREHFCPCHQNLFCFRNAYLGYGWRWSELIMARLSPALPGLLLMGQQWSKFWPVTSNNDYFPSGRPKHGSCVFPLLSVLHFDVGSKAALAALAWAAVGRDWRDSQGNAGPEQGAAETRASSQGLFKVHHRQKVISFSHHTYCLYSSRLNILLEVIQHDSLLLLLLN